MKPDYQLLDVEQRLLGNVGDTVIENSQAIPSEFIDSLKSERYAKEALRMGDYERVASVPTSVYDIWQKQGRDPYRAPAKDIVKWLKEDGLDYFVTTSKRV